MVWQCGDNGGGSTGYRVKICEIAIVRLVVKLLTQTRMLAEARRGRMSDAEEWLRVKEKKT